MRADRLLSLLLLLQVHGRMTARDLAERLEVSERTIYRDLDALSASGIPVYGDHGPGGGYSLLDSYRTNLTGLTDAEVRTLFVSGLQRPLEDLGLAEALNLALLKLSAALPSTQRQGVQEMRQRIHIDTMGWFQSPEAVPHLHVLQEAVWSDRKVHLVYQRGDGSQGERVIDHYGLVAKSNIWYLVASIGAEMRVYRVGRIQSVTLCAEEFQRRADFDLATFWSAWSTEFETSRPQYAVTLRIAPDFAPALIQIWGESVREVLDKAVLAADGWLEADFNFDRREWACERILSLGTNVVVKAPQELREALAQMARDVLAVYHGY